MFSVKMRDTISSLLKGTWCSGITSALHAEGPGLNPQCVHVQEKGRSGIQRCWVFLVSRRGHLPGVLVARLGSVPSVAMCKRRGVLHTEMLGVFAEQPSLFGSGKGCSGN